MGFNKRLSELRNIQKISQGKRAKRIWVHTNVMGRYEWGEVKPPYRYFGKAGKSRQEPHSLYPGCPFSGMPKQEPPTDKTGHSDYRGHQ